MAEVLYVSANIMAAVGLLLLLASAFKLVFDALLGELWNHFYWPSWYDSYRHWEALIAYAMLAIGIALLALGMVLATVLTPTQTAG